MGKQRRNGLWIFVLRHIQMLAGTFISVVVVIGMIVGAANRYATADEVKKLEANTENKFAATNADVEKKFSAVKVEIKTVALEARRQRLEDELFRLRTNVNEKGAMAQIQRYESELRDVTARLRQLEERRP